ncbi:IucA/IucC family siderophore biosynthesis protein [Alkalihalobacillus sp. AL-G]|uniref:IucA/IucC family protein n=1 Tax=Alkalihalobacillus sp. AL-G TaxID=2926399 RepID=UPI00272A48F3|nr:IucA/IucC family protein [Alkalihalobacillus sp. AL-G]WLD92624.1 hypothetical protein MOJ78_16635 [Alkalihalobacillus sp. AL-G]
MNQLIFYRENEKTVLDCLHKKHPVYSTIFQRFLPMARKRTLHQLIQALLREEVVKATWYKKDGDFEVTIPVYEDGKLVVPVSKRYSLHHIEISGDLFYSFKGSRRKVDHPVEFIKLLSIKQESLVIELENSVVNYALALTAAELRKEKLSWGGDVFSYLLKEKKVKPNFSPLVFAEQWVIEGHTLHPCSKTRLGLSTDDVMNFSPEWEGNPNVIPVAVHRDHVRMSSMDEYSMTEMLINEYPEVEKAFRELTSKGLGDYELIPIHPWQFEHTIKIRFQSEIDQGVIVPLEKTSIPTDALMSFRSLAPTGSRTHHHIKTAVDVQMTSAKRIVSPASVSNGPVISALLKKIQLNDPSIGSTLQFLAEKAGGHYQSHANEEDMFLMKNLSALVRENPEADLQDEEIAVPAAFLISQSPFTGKLILVELIEAYGRSMQINMEEAAIEYMKVYTTVLFPGLITLMVKYGISLEAHLQNAIPVFQQGRPVRFLLRDNGGIRIKRDRLDQMTGAETIDNSTNLLTDSTKDLFTMFSHALFHNHVGEMIVHVSKELGIAERKVWRSVKEVIYSTIDDLKKDEDCRVQAEELERELSSPFTSLKALVKMRLSEQVSENAYVSVPNPMLEQKEGVYEHAD